MTIELNILYGYRGAELRYVRVGKDILECQGRSKDFDRDGVCTKITPWETISRMTNVPDELMPGHGHTNIPAVALIVAVQLFILAGLNVGQPPNLLALWLELTLSQVLGAMLCVLVQMGRKS